MILYNGVWIPDHIRIDQSYRITMDEILIEMGHDREVIEIVRETSMKTTGDPVAILDECYDFVAVFQSIPDLKKEVGDEVVEFVDSGFKWNYFFYVIRISRSEFNEALEIGIPMQFCIGKTFKQLELF